MDRFEKDAILVTLIECLKGNGSWCGETHIQKSAYLLQKLTNLDLGFDFILYKHGPFSFDLSDELLAMQIDNFIEHIPTPPYGSCYTLAKQSEKLKNHYYDFIEENKDKIKFITQKVGQKGVAELETLATALYVTKQKIIEADKRSERITELKPHVSTADAENAISDIDMFIEESKAIVLT